MQIIFSSSLNASLAVVYGFNRVGTLSKKALKVQMSGIALSALIASTRPITDQRLERYIDKKSIDLLHGAVSMLIIGCASRYAKLSLKTSAFSTLSFSVTQWGIHKAGGILFPPQEGNKQKPPPSSEEKKSKPTSSSSVGPKGKQPEPTPSPVSSSDMEVADDSESLKMDGLSVEEKYETLLNSLRLEPISLQVDVDPLPDSPFAQLCSSAKGSPNKVNTLRQAAEKVTGCRDADQRNVWVNVLIDAYIQANYAGLEGAVINWIPRNNLQLVRYIDLCIKKTQFTSAANLLIKFNGETKKLVTFCLTEAMTAKKEKFVGPLIQALQEYSDRDPYIIAYIAACIKKGRYSEARNAAELLIVDPKSKQTLEDYISEKEAQFAALLKKR